MNIAEWVVLAAVILGVVAALAGWDRYRGSRKRDSDAGALQPTDEVFVDQETGRRTRVWYDAASGRREYRAE
jgi:hypothetical protein